MSKVWYGNLTNRLEENKMFCEEIKVGTGMTEYYYSDRHPYEVVEVIDQKHIKVRKLDHKHIGEGCMDNNWELISNENNSVKLLTKRGKYWYWTVTAESKDFDFDNLDIETRLWFCHQNILIDDLKAKGKITRYHRANVSFGVADYYYDYSF
jgi:hypothetical protein